MKTSLSVPLREQENLKKLFKLMDENGLKEEKAQVMELADYIDSMDAQFGKVLEELGAVREELGKLQEKGIRSVAIKAVTKAEEKVEGAKMQLQAVKVRFLSGVNKAVENFKEKGVSALSKSIQVLGIQKGLVKIQESLHQSIEAVDKGFQHLGDIGDEIHGVRKHLGNIRRKLAGKESQDVGFRDVEKGAVYQVQKLLYQTAGMLEGMEKRTDKALEKLGYLEQRKKSPEKSSVRENLKDIQASGHANEKVVEVSKKLKESAR